MALTGSALAETCNCYSTLACPCLAGLELFFIDAVGAAASNGPTWAAPSAFFAFGSEEERERAAAVLTGQAALGSSLPGGRSAAAAAGSTLEVPLSLGEIFCLLMPSCPGDPNTLCGQCQRRTCQAHTMHCTGAPQYHRFEPEAWSSIPSAYCLTRLRPCRHRAGGCSA